MQYLRSTDLYEMIIMAEFHENTCAGLETRLVATFGFDAVDNELTAVHNLIFLWRFFMKW